MGHVKLSGQERIKVAVMVSDPLRLAGYRALFECQEGLELFPTTLCEITDAVDTKVLLLGKRQNQNISAIMQSLRSARPALRVLIDGERKSGGVQPIPANWC